MNIDYKDEDYEVPQSGIIEERNNLEDGEKLKTLQFNALLIRRAESIEHELRIEIQEHVSHVQYDVFYHASVTLSVRR